MAFTTSGSRTGAGSFTKFPGAVVEKKTVKAVRLLSGVPYLDSWKADDFAVQVVWDNPDVDWVDDLYLGGSMFKAEDGTLTGFRGAFVARELYDLLGVELPIEDRVPWPVADGDGEPVDMNARLTAAQGLVFHDDDVEYRELSACSAGQIAALGIVGYVPQDVLDRAVGQEYLQLRYDFRLDNSGDKPKMKRRTFRRVEKVGADQADETMQEAAQRLYDTFVDSADGGYQKDWRRPSEAAQKPPAAPSSGVPADPFAATPASGDGAPAVGGTESYEFVPDDDLPF